MTIDDSFSEQDRAALAFCIAILQNEPNADYKEARREARVTRGLSVRRQIWSAARRQLGIVKDEVVPADVDGSAAPQMEDPPREATPDRGRDDPRRPPREDRGSGARRDGNHERDPFRRPDDQRPRHDGRPGREERRLHDSGRDQEPQWPGGRKPAWAMPKPERKEPAPTANSMFLNPARNPIEFMVQYLKTTNAEASFDEVRRAAEEAGYTIYPATFGRAQALAGLLDDEVTDEPIRVAPESSAPPAAPTPPAPAPTPAAAPRQKRTVEAPVNTDGIDPVAGLHAFMAALGKAERDQAVLKNKVQSMLDVIHRALDD